MHEGLPVITLREPWATFVIRGWKTVEVRPFQRLRSLEGRTIGIHAGERWDSNYLLKADPYMDDYQRGVMADIRKRRVQGILGIALVRAVGHVGPAESRAAMMSISWSSEVRWGLVLDDVFEYSAPILCAGHQGIWYYEGAEGGDAE